jgi:RimJ/RimL family protein N-acetyltransferase
VTQKALAWAADLEEKLFAARFVESLTPHITRPRTDGNFQAAVVLEGGEARGAVLFTDWFPEYQTMQVHIGGIGPGWLTRGILRELFAYPFARSGVNKLWCMMRHDAPHVLDFNKRLGFRPEGTLRDQFGPGVHGVVARMTRGEWRRTPYFVEAS